MEDRGMNNTENNQKESNDDTILKYIDDILINNNFERMIEKEEACANILEDTWRIYGPVYGGFEQYIVVINLSQNVSVKLEEFLFRQERLYTELRNVSKGTFDKNVSLLLCASNTKIELKKDKEKHELFLEKNILKIEEDPYFFKKLVLTYTDNELSMLEKATSSSGTDGWGLLKAKINELEENLSDDVFEKAAQDIILRMYIKLPFTSIDITREGKMVSIMNEVQKQMISDDEIRIWDLINNMELDEIKEIKNMENTLQETLLNTWMPKKEGEKK